MKLEQFIEKHQGKRGFDHVLDYLNANDFQSKSINFSFEQAVEKAETWTLELNQKNQATNNSGVVEKVLSFPDGYSVVRLMDQDARSWEGKLMGHCVASYSDEEELYSLRDPKGFPHCTMEKEEGCLIQIKGKGNKKIVEKYEDYIFEFASKTKCDIAIKEMENINYCPLVSTVGKIDFENTFENAKILKLKSQKFIKTTGELVLNKGVRVSSSALFLFLCKSGQSLPTIKKILKAREIPVNEIEEGIADSLGNNDAELFKLLIEQLPSPLKFTEEQTNFISKIIVKVCNLEMLNIFISKGGKFPSKNLVDLFLRSLDNESSEVSLFFVEKYGKKIFNKELSKDKIRSYVHRASSEVIENTYGFLNNQQKNIILTSGALSVAKSRSFLCKKILSDESFRLEKGSVEPALVSLVKRNDVESFNKLLTLSLEYCVKERVQEVDEEEFENGLLANVFCLAFQNSNQAMVKTMVDRAKELKINPKLILEEDILSTQQLELIDLIRAS